MNWLLSSIKIRNNRSPPHWRGWRFTSSWWNLYERPPQMLDFWLNWQLSARTWMSKRCSPGLMLGLTIRYFFHSAYLWQWLFHCLRQVCYSSRFRFSFCRGYEGILKRSKNGRIVRDTCCIRQAAQQATETWSLLLEQHKLSVLARLNKYHQ